MTFDLPTYRFKLLHEIWAIRPWPEIYFAYGLEQMFEKMMTEIVRGKYLPCSLHFANSWNE